MRTFITLHLGRGIRVALEFKLADCWIGLYWDVRVGSIALTSAGTVASRQVEIWVCLVPCFPLHFTIPKESGK